MNGKVALVFIFNHRYDKNISKLEALYKERFSHIFHLVPFYDGDKANVIPVYENSFYFQGYLAQGFKHYFRETFDHYIFLGDDLILNPAIHEHNYIEHFGLSPEASYIPEVYTLDNLSNSDTLYFHPGRIMDRIKKREKNQVSKWVWNRVAQAYYYRPAVQGVETKGEIPTAEEAQALIERHGIKINPLQHIDIFGGLTGLRNMMSIRKNMDYVLKQKIVKKQYPLTYPIVASYSDIVIVSSQSVRKFIHYCGVFAATELFVELAIPTALLLAAGKVVTEPQLGKRGILYWPWWEAQRYEAEMQKLEYRMNNLLAQFPEDKLYIHPIKLSQWK